MYYTVWTLKKTRQKENWLIWAVVLEKSKKYDGWTLSKLDIRQSIEKLKETVQIRRWRDLAHGIANNWYCQLNESYQYHHHHHYTVMTCLTFSRKGMFLDFNCAEDLLKFNICLAMGKSLTMERLPWKQLSSLIDLPLQFAALKEVLLNCNVYSWGVIKQAPAVIHRVRQSISNQSRITAFLWQEYKLTVI